MDDKTYHALLSAQVRIKELREAMLAVLCDPEGQPCFAGSDGDRKVIADAISRTDDLAALQAFENEVIERCARVCREIAILRLDSGLQPGCCSQVADMCNTNIREMKK